MKTFMAQIQEVHRQHSKVWLKQENGYIAKNK
jgi:hypothetical protein